MQNIRSFKEAEAILAPYISPVVHGPYKLGTMKKLMTFLGDPQNKLRIIHVAGTSGKTSTSYYLAALIHAAGFKVGLSISPHIDSVAERAQIDMHTLEEKDFCYELSLFLELVEKSRLKPSYFEVLVAFMYWLFEKRGVEYAVVEVGLGGLLDGTNVIDRADKVCVITDIGFDHMNILGNTLPEIAAQKAGIILPVNRVFMHTQSEEVMQVIERTVKEKNAKLTVVSDEMPFDDTSLPTFQKRNLSLALQTITHILPKTSFSKDKVRDILATYIPARMEVVEWRDKILTLDGSHNEQKLSALATAMKEKYGETPMCIVAAFGKNKSVSLKENLHVLRSLSDSVIFTQFDHGQDEVRVPIAPADIAEVATSEHFKEVIIEPNPEKALLDATDRPEEIILITGSFYLLSQIRPFIFTK